MATQTTPKPISTGSCAFCKAEIAKNKMTQHLKSCKQRLAANTAHEEQSTTEKTRLFHILAEGKYNPEYWLHFEVAATESLWSVDNFLKDIWIDDLDHLSGFNINETSYSDDYSDGYFTSFEVVEDENEAKGEDEEEEISEEERQKEIEKFVDEIAAQYAESVVWYQNTLIPPEPMSAEWLAEIKKPRSVDDLLDLLKVERARIRKEEKAVFKGNVDRSQKSLYTKANILRYQKIIVEDLLDINEDRSMEVSLRRVLKVGQKFSYIYDYGSSTYVNLKVLGEREGIAQSEKKPVQLLARNIEYAYSCTVCGKPATKVAMGYYYGNSFSENLFCTICAKEHIDEEETLPIINSPRVGVL